MKLRLFVLSVMACVVGACGGGTDGDADAEQAPRSVTGIVTEVESSGLNDVTSFKVKEGDRVFEILIDDSVNYGFPLGHVEEHRKLAEPVKVELEERDGKLYAQTIEDAPLE